MKIALLNLPLDNNYGGYLQRYALMKTLQGMGHSVEHVFLVNDTRINMVKYLILYIKGIVKKYIYHKIEHIDADIRKMKVYDRKMSSVYTYYEKQICHTKICYNVRDLKKICTNFDIFVVGSDQVWRKDMTASSLGWQNYLLEFLNNTKVKKIAYGASFGIDKTNYTKSEKRKFAELYSQFDAVSVREKSAISLLAQMGCKRPIPVQVLDPTLLLDKQCYIDLFKNRTVLSNSKNKIFCYVLDANEDINRIIQLKSKEMNLDCCFMDIATEDFNLPLWLQSFFESTYIITDSYHGVVFSIIFNKPFLFCGNERRGNNRIESLFEYLKINLDKIDYRIVNENISKCRMSSLAFIEASTSSCA